MQISISFSKVSIIKISSTRRSQKLKISSKRSRSVENIFHAKKQIKRSRSRNRSVDKSWKYLLRKEAKSWKYLLKEADQEADLSTKVENISYTQRSQKLKISSTQRNRSRSRSVNKSWKYPLNRSRSRSVNKSWKYPLNRSRSRSVNKSWKFFLRKETEQEADLSTKVENILYAKKQICRYKSEFTLKNGSFSSLKKKIL